MLSIKPYLSHKIFPLISFQISSFALPWLLTIWLTYHYSLNEAGEFTYALALLTPFCLLLASPSRNFILTEHDTSHFAFKCRLLLMSFGLIITVIISTYFNNAVFFSGLFLLKMTELLFDIPISRAVYVNNVKSLWIINLYKWGLIGCSFVIGFFVNNIQMLFFICAFGFFIIVVKSLNLSEQKGALRELIKVIKSSLPLGLSSLIFAIHFNIPRYIIGGAEQKELLAIYSISSFIIMAAVVLVNIFVQAKLPHLKKIMNTRHFYREIVKILVIAVLIFIVIQLAHLSLFSTIFWQLHNNVQQGNAMYSQLYEQIVWLAWGPIIFSIANYFLMLSGQHKSLLLITSVNIVLTYFLCFYAQQINGIFWLLWAYNLGCLFQCAAIFVTFRKGQKS